MKTLKQILKEIEVEFIPDIAKKSKTWYMLDTKEVLKISDNVIDLIQTAYAKTSDGSFVNSKSDIARSYFWTAISWDELPDADAIIFGRKSPQGIKIQGIGHDGQKQSREFVIKRLVKLLNTTGYWVEASDAMEHVLYKNSVPYISDENKAQKVFPNSNLTMIGDKGKYQRRLENGKKIKETIFGKPKI